jgi:hypothetical protein
MNLKVLQFWNTTICPHKIGSSNYKESQKYSIVGLVILESLQYRVSKFFRLADAIQKYRRLHLTAMSLKTENIKHLRIWAVGYRVFNTLNLFLADYSILAISSA